MIDIARGFNFAEYCANLLAGANFEAKTNKILESVVHDVTTVDFSVLKLVQVLLNKTTFPHYSI